MIIVGGQKCSKAAAVIFRRFNIVCCSQNIGWANGHTRGLLPLAKIAFNGLALDRIHGDNPERTSPDALPAPGTFFFIDSDDVQLLVENEGIELTGSLAGRILTLLAGDGNVYPGCHFDQTDPGSQRIESAGML